MNAMKICYFDNNMGKYDEFNPRFVFNEPNTKDIVTILSQYPKYYFTNDKLSKRLGFTKQEYDQAMKLLDNISAVVVDKYGRIRLNFPFFTAKDLKRITNIMNYVLKTNKRVIEANAERLNQIARKIYPNIPVHITLYHLLCGKIFDGEFFEYLTRSNLLNISYPKNGNRDYMLIGYHDDKFCNKFNESLLCSFNNAWLGKSALTSFGTPNERLDYFRYFKLRETGKLPTEFQQLDGLLKNFSDEEVVSGSLDIVKNLRENNVPLGDNLLEALKITGYVSQGNKLTVPVFDNYIEKVQLLHKEVVQIFGDYIKFYLNLVKERVLRENILCVNHEVPVDELTNELWHIFFGQLNNYLVEKNIVARPIKYKSQGSYLKCVYLN